MLEQLQQAHEEACEEPTAVPKPTAAGSTPEHEGRGRTYSVAVEPFHNEDGDGVTKDRDGEALEAAINENVEARVDSLDPQRRSGGSGPVHRLCAYIPRVLPSRAIVWFWMGWKCGMVEDGCGWHPLNTVHCACGLRCVSSEQRRMASYGAVGSSETAAPQGGGGYESRRGCGGSVRSHSNPTWTLL